jgi:regulator of Ty1 transposition protein 103
MSSYSTDLVINKLSSLNESQDSITSVSQCSPPALLPLTTPRGPLPPPSSRRDRANMAAVSPRRFAPAKRRADDKASSANRKLVLIYLANDVVQQSKARRKDEFPRQFAGIIAEAMEIAYRGTTADIQGKIRRVLSVWRDRSIFEPAILGEIDQRLDSRDLLRVC